MAPSHRPDIHLLRRRKPTDGVLLDPSEREAVLWPYINLEDLGTTPRLLIDLLTSRGWKYGIDAFPFVDLHRKRWEFVERLLGLQYAPGYSTVTRGPSYGKLVSFPNPEDEALCRTWGSVIPSGHGLFLLEIQERLYRFLLDMARLILGDASPKALLGQNVDTPHVYRPIREAEHRRLLPPERIDDYYLLPREDLGEEMSRGNSWRALPRLQAKLDELHDHFFLLRHDPGYFAQEMQKWKEHRPEMLLDQAGRRHPLVDQPGQDELWARAVEDCFLVNVQIISVWDELVRRVKYLGEREVPGKKKEIEVREWQGKDSLRMPVEYIPEDSIPVIAMALLLSHIKDWTGSLLKLFRKIWSFSPGIGQFSRRVVAKSETIGDQPHEYGDLQSFRKRESWEYFEWLFNSLFDAEMPHMLTYTTILDEIERLCLTSPVESKVLSDLVHFHMSILALYFRFAEALFPTMDAKLKTARESDRYRSVIMPQVQDARKRLMSTFKFQGSRELWSLGNPADGRFEYPIDKSVKTEEEQKQTLDAEQALRRFWNRFQVESEKQGLWYPHAEPIIPPGHRLYERFDATSKENSDKFLDTPRRPQNTAGRGVPASSSSSKSTGTNDKSLGATGSNRTDEGTLTSQALESQEKAGIAASSGTATNTGGSSKKKRNKKKGKEPEAEADDVVHQARTAAEAAADAFLTPPPPRPPPPADAPMLHPVYGIRLDLDDESFNVFKTMMVLASENWTPRPVTWERFLLAMKRARLGCLRLYDRSWVLTPLTINVTNANMVVEEPGPGAKLTVSMLRQVGIRMFYLYALDFSDFRWVATTTTTTN
jgi:hypothetical protein